MGRFGRSEAATFDGQARVPVCERTSGTVRAKARCWRTPERCPSGRTIDGRLPERRSSVEPEYRAYRRLLHRSLEAQRDGGPTPFRPGGHRRWDGRDQPGVRRCPSDRTEPPGAHRPHARCRHRELDGPGGALHRAVHQARGVRGRPNPGFDLSGMRALLEGHATRVSNLHWGTITRVLVSAAPACSVGVAAARGVFSGSRAADRLDRLDSPRD